MVRTPKILPTILKRLHIILGRQFSLQIVFYIAMKNQGSSGGPKRPRACAHFTGNHKNCISSRVTKYQHPV
uniref:Uncharacterized protein n=1 Tax=Anguilla anguilla TaxID=7936 RepID=A0A0E9QUA4_ANGAN